MIARLFMIGCVGLAIVGLVSAPTAHAYVFDEKGVDRRHIVKRSGPDGYMAAPIGSVTRTITRSSERQGSGFLVSPCLVLTNDHVVFKEKESRNSSTFERIHVTFQAGESGGKNDQVAAGHPFVTLRGFGEDERFDAALVRLTPDHQGKCAGERVGWIELAGPGNIGQNQLEAIGFPYDRDRRFAWSDGPEPVIETHQDTWLIDYQGATQPGNSGSLLGNRDVHGWLVASGLVEAVAGPARETGKMATERQQDRYFKRVYSRPTEKRFNVAIDVRFLAPLLGIFIRNDIQTHRGVRNVARLPYSP